MRLRLLGGFDVAVAGRSVGERAWRLRKAADLVKILALAPGRRLHREQLVELLWPDRPAASAANNLHQAMHVARRAVAIPGGRFVVLAQDVVRLCPDDPPHIDVVTFEDAARRAAGTRDVAA